MQTLQKGNSTSFKKLFLYFVEFVILFLAGNILMAILTEGLYAVLVPRKESLSLYFRASVDYFVFIGFFVVLFAYIFVSKTNRPILKCFTTACKGNKAKWLFLGLLLGFCLNSICVLAAVLSNSISLSFNEFQPFWLIYVLACVFIQSAAEEALCRGFLYQKLRKCAKNPWVAIVGNAVVFSAIHLLNPGISITAIISIVAVGVFFSLIVYYFDSLWCAMAIHAAWNFTQAIVYGLPNSGLVSPVSVFALNSTAEANSFTYDIIFGVEASLFCFALWIVGCVAVVLIGRKTGVKSKSVWQENELDYAVQ